MAAEKYLKRLRSLTKTRSDYAVAKLLGVSQDAIHHYRRGTRSMSPTIALLIADLLKLPPLLVICDAEIDRAASPAMRERWTKLRTQVARDRRQLRKLRADERPV